MNPKLVVSALVVCFVMSLASGCGPAKRPTVKTAKISGTVKLKGQALAGATVNFLAADYAGVATTDAAGHYELDAQPGENTIYITKYEGVGPDFDETMTVESDMPGGGPKQLVPKEYSEASSSTLRFTVPDEGSEAADFDLK